MAGDKTYAIICHDGPDSAQKRLDMRDAHFAHIEKVLDHIAIAGPLKDGKGSIAGSLLVLKASSTAKARALLEEDPYYKAGIWADIHIQEFTPAAGAWIGGKIW